MNPRYRIYAAVGLVAALLMVGGFLVLGRGGSSTTSSVTPASTLLKRLHAKQKKAAPRANVRPTKRTRPAKKVQRRRRAHKPSRTRNDGMPEALTAALTSHGVAVVALVAPDATVDELALEEARAGARAAHAGFAEIRVSNNDDVQALTTLVNGSSLASDRLLDAPAVLIFRRPQQLFVRFNGFIDADTVAQAVHNAAVAG